VKSGPIDIHCCNACTGGDKHALRSTLTKNTDDLPQADRLARACVELCQVNNNNNNNNNKRGTPAEPVKNTLFPCFTRSTTYCCSSESFTALGLAGACRSISAAIHAFFSAASAPTDFLELGGPGVSCGRWDGASAPRSAGKIHSIASSRFTNRLYSALGYLCTLKQPQKHRSVNKRPVQLLPADSPSVHIPPMSRKPAALPALFVPHTIWKV